MNELEDDEIVLRVEKDPLIGKKLGGRYQIASVLGRGGMGVVYKATQVDIDRPVALKTLHISKVIDSKVIQKFRSEAQAICKVRHPNTVMVYDFGVSDEGVPFLVMDLINGISFRQVVKEHAPLLNLGRVYNVFKQICAALTAAHEAGIVHRDLKPENIMLCPKQGQPDWVYVFDFGIAGMMDGSEQDREIIGSPPYMSPEQCSTEGKIDHRTDIYALGVCLFEALSGKFPFQARTAMEMMECHLHQKPRVLKELDSKFGTYESIGQVILKAMDKQPEKRQQSVKEFAMELEDAIKKDSRRGMQLKDRVTMEITAPKTEDFVAVKQDNPGLESGIHKSIVEKVQAFVQGDQRDEPEKEEEDAESKYYFSHCPHCEAPTEPGISLCLACGRSLASKSDFSKIRASRGDFSLPRHHELSTSQANSAKGFSQKSKSAMGSNRIWSKSLLMVLVGFLLLGCAFVFMGGGKWLSITFGSSQDTMGAPSDNTSVNTSTPAQ